MSKPAQMALERIYTTYLSKDKKPTDFIIIDFEIVGKALKQQAEAIEKLTRKVSAQADVIRELQNDGSQVMKLRATVEAQQKELARLNKQYVYKGGYDECLT